MENLISVLASEVEIILQQYVKKEDKERSKLRDNLGLWGKTVIFSFINVTKKKTTRETIFS